MSNLLKNVQTVDELIRSMHKISSFCMNGQVIQANREARSVMSRLEKAKAKLMTEGNDQNYEQPAEDREERLQSHCRR